MKVLYKLILVLAVIFATTTPKNASASHVSGGDFYYECVGTDSFRIVLNLFRDCSGISMSTTAFVNFTSTCGGTASATLNIVPNPVTGDNFTNISQLCAADSLNSTCFNGALPGMQLYTYEAIVVLSPPCDTWTMSWSTCCRNATVNVPSSSGDNIYLEATINSQTDDCNNSPVFTSQPIPYVCINQPVNYNYGVIEPDGDSLVYSLIPGMTGATGNLTYGGGYSGASPLAGITIDPQTGLLSFTPNTLGNFIVVVMVEEYDANGNLLGTTMRDIQFVVQNCTNIVPDPPTTVNNVTGNANQIGPMSVELCEGSSVCFEATFTDVDPNDTLSLTTNVDQVLPGATWTVTGANPATIQICWLAQPGSPTFNSFTVDADDGACPVAGISSAVFEVHVITSTYAGPDQTICGAQTATLPATGGTIFNWSVLSGDPIVVGTNFSCNPCANPVAQPANTTTYVVTSNLSGNCVNTDTVTVNVVPDFTYQLTQSSNTSCLLEDVQIDLIPNGNGPFTYTWTPGTFLSSTTVSSPTVTATSPGTYDYFVEMVSADGCTYNDSISITVAAAYQPDITVSANDSSIICGDTVQLDLDLGGGIPAVCGPSPTTACSAPASNQTIGNVTGQNTTTTWPAPYGNWYRNAKHQFLFTAAELNAMGFIGGKITEISWEVTQINGTTVYNAYQISMGCTQSTQLTSWETGLTQVFAPQNIGITTGWNTHQLTTAYEWDGVSNLVVEVCYDNLALTYTNNSITPWTTTTFNSTLYYFSDSQPACPATTATPSSNRPVTRFTTCPTIPDPANYTIAWTPAASLNDPTILDPLATPFQTTTYLATVTDNNGGCTDTASVAINVICDSCFTPIPELFDPICNGDSSGYLIGTPIYLLSPITVEWFDVATGNLLQTNPNMTAGSDTLWNVPAGDYLLVITDTSGCTADTMVTLVDPPMTTIVASNDTLICVGGTATISATPAGGSGGPYTEVWDNGLIGNGPHPVSPTGNGCYIVYAQDTFGCASLPDTVCVALYPDIVGSTSGNDSICQGDNITINASAIGGSGTGYNYEWQDVNGNVIGTGASITVTPTSAAEDYCVSITDDCETPAVVECLTIYWYANPVPQFIADITEDCAPANVTFTNTTPLGSVGTVEWNFGDINNTTDNNTVSSSFSYTTPGCYDVSLTVTSPEGCTMDTTFDDYICARPYPTAAFDFGPQPTDFLNSEIAFTNLSFDNFTNYWNFNNGQGESELVNPSFEFPSDEPGSYPVYLAVANEYGCVDTAWNTVVIDGAHVIYAPNAFTPNGDGFNDVFLPQGEGIDLTGYQLEIYNRWGELIFVTEDFYDGWDGTTNGSVPAEVEVYVWKIKSKDLYSDDKFEYVGHVTLIR